MDPFWDYVAREVILDRWRTFVECPSCKAARDNCRLCGGTGVVTEQQARDWPDAA